MLTFLRNLHRFLASQSFYPLALSTLLAGSFYAGRVVISRDIEFVTLVWNLFLAWVPYRFSVAAATLHRLYPKGWWLLPLPGLVWLVFFPNAPYLVTDLYHLEYRPPVPMWYDIGMIAIYAFTGLFLAVASLRTMQTQVRAYLGGAVSWLFAAVAIGLGGLGIYLGRFVRVNSWDVVLDPFLIVRELAAPMLDPLDNLRFFGFTLMFTAILLVFYLMFVSVNRDEPRIEMKNDETRKP